MSEEISINCESFTADEIMKKVAKRISERQYNKDILEKIDDDLPEWREETNGASLNASLERLAQMQNVPIFWEMERQRGPLGSVKVFLKKVVRKVNFFYFSHVFGFQNAYNAQICAVLHELSTILRTNLADTRHQSDELSAVDFEVNSVRGEARRASTDILHKLSAVSELADSLELRLHRIQSNADMRYSELKGRLAFTHSDEIRQEMLNTKGEYLSQLTEIKSEQYNALDRQRQAFEAQLETARSDYAERLNRIEDSYKIQISSIKNEFLTGMRDLEQRYAEKQSEMNSVYTVIATRLFRLENSRRMSETAAEPGLLDRIALPEFTSVQSLPPFDYFTFESRFRGSPDAIRKKQQRYLEYFIGKENVLDFGCGRGEFLSLLSESGVDAIGVDVMDENVIYCNDMGYNARCEDGFEYLDSCEDGSLGGIFAAQVIEHLTNDELLRLIATAYRKLRSGGSLVLETLNPRCLMIFAESFYLDLSHIRPIHPETLRFLAESEGFADVRIDYFTPSDESVRMPFLPDFAQADRAISTINDLLFGNREYALIARKPL